ncbi:NADPH-dependent F420 reductase [Arthrobacter sp. MDT1-48-3]
MSENTTPRTGAPRSTIGFIGSGHIGSQLARLAVARGYRVVMSNSRGPETLQDLVRELGDAARAGTVDDAAREGDVVVVTIPLKDIGSVPVEPLAGKLVIDTCNYYPDRDGRIAELDDETTTTSELVQRHLPGSSVVKVFNNIAAAQLTTDGTPAGTPDRRALPIAGDDSDAKQAVVELLDEFGFDAVDAGSLAEGWRFQRDTPGYGTVHDADGMRGALGQARRYAEMG